MSAQDHLQPAQFPEYYHRAQPPNRSGAFHQVHAVDQGKVIGYLTWGPNDTRVGDLWVDPQYRHQGVATGMWKHAQTVEPLNHHVDRSDAGDGWAKAVSGDTVSARENDTVEKVNHTARAHLMQIRQDDGMMNRMPVE